MAPPHENPRDILAAEEFALPAPDPRLQRDGAHDVLAAEEFAVPAPDPRLHRGEARDVLAAEEFVLPAPDPRLRINSEPLALPPDPKDPSGAEPAHDVLAAEEFALPGPGPGVDEPAPSGGPAGQRRARGRVVLAIGAAVIVLRRALGRRQRSA